MKNLINKSQKHLLWKDECGDTFLLLPWCEIFRYSKTELRLFVWSFQKRLMLHGKGLILNETHTDEQFYVLNVDRRNLPSLIALSSSQKRLARHSKRMRNLEERLGHKIIPFNPQLSV